MNLYRILFAHLSPKDREEGIRTYLLAENEKQVYKFIDEKFQHTTWKDKEEEDKEFKERILEAKGEMYDEEYDNPDLYYGATIYGWELVKENIINDLSEMIELGIIVKL